MSIGNFIIFLLTNLSRTYIIKKMFDLFLYRKNGNKWLYNTSFVVFFVVTAVGYLLFFEPTINIVTNVAGLGLIVYFYQGRVRKKIIIVVLIYAVNMLCDVVAVLSFPDYMMRNMENQIPGITTVLLISISYIIISKICLSKSNPHFLFPQWKFLIIIPVCGITIIHYLVTTNIANYNLIVIEGGGLLIINIISFYLFVSMEKVLIENIEKKEIENQYKIYAEQLDIIINTDSKIRSLQHDLKHHLRELKGMAQNSKSDEIVKYVSEMYEITSNPREHIYSGNKEIDSLLNYWIEKAKNLLDNVNIMVKIPEKMEINSFNLNIILSNLFENAIEGAEKSKEKTLNVELKVDRGLFFITIINSYDGIIHANMNTIGTCKKNRQMHGFGLKNVRYIVSEKCNGQMNIKYDEKIFRVEIMMYI